MLKWAFLLAWAGGLAVAATRIQDTVYLQDGITKARGKITLTWGSFTTAGGRRIPSGQAVYELRDGSFDVLLEPTTSSTPKTFYRAQYTLYPTALNPFTTVANEYWVIPPSTPALGISAVASNFQPETSQAISLSQLQGGGAATGQAPIWDGTKYTPGTVLSATATAVNLVFAGPVSGGPAIPTFRSLAKADLPATIVYTDQGNTYGAGQLQNFGLARLLIPNGGVSLPLTCTQGEMFLFNTGGYPHWCTSTNTWVSAVSSANSVTGLVQIANGGTGQTTAAAARNALLPSQATFAGRVLGTDGTNVSWVVGGGGGAGVNDFLFSAAGSVLSMTAGTADLGSVTYAVGSATFTATGTGTARIYVTNGQFDGMPPGSVVASWTGTGGTLSCASTTTCTVIPLTSVFPLGSKALVEWSSTGATWNGSGTVYRSLVTVPIRLTSTNPIVVSANSTGYDVSCPTCGAGGTSYIADRVLSCTHNHASQAMCDWAVVTTSPVVFDRVSAGSTGIAIAAQRIPNAPGADDYGHFSLPLTANPTTGKIGMWVMAGQSTTTGANAVVNVDVGCQTVGTRGYDNFSGLGGVTYTAAGTLTFAMPTQINGDQFTSAPYVELAIPSFPGNCVSGATMYFRWSRSAADAFSSDEFLIQRVFIQVSKP